jgi:hypothetical protein
LISVGAAGLIEPAAAVTLPAAFRLRRVSPAFRVIGPVKVLVPVRLRMPSPKRVTPLVPERTPLRVIAPAVPPVVAA